jgi:hypothetical protein
VKRLRLDQESEPFPIVFAGGNLTHENSKLASLLSEKLKKELPNANILMPVVSPAVAAALLLIERHSLK